MKRTPGEISKMTERFEAVIRRAGVKLTPQRIAIYREVACTYDHPDIESIYKNVRRRLPSVSLDTVYRTLGLFSDLGLISTVRPLGYRLRFDANTSPHHHFVCTRCSATLDFEHREFDTLRIPDAASSLGRVDSRHVEVRGLCSACAAGPPDKNTSRTSGTWAHRHKNQQIKEGLP